MRHDACTHPRTPAGRTACRKGAPEGPQIAAETISRTRRVSRRTPRVELPEALQDAYASLVARHLPTVVHSPYREDEGVLTSSSERGVLHITWLIADPASFVTTFREVGTPVAYRKASIAEGMEML